MRSEFNGAPTRRTFVRTGFGGVAAMGLYGVAGCAGIGQRPVPAFPFTQGTDAPKTIVPANACDCHHHVYDSRFALAPGVATAPPNATADDYLLFQKRLGTRRHIVVTPSAYGTDNSCTLDALAKFGKHARGVAVVDTSVTDAELKRLYDLGIRGVRVNVPPKIATTVDMIEPLSRRVAPFGMHVQIHMFANDIEKMSAVLMRLPSNLVIDHFGRISQPAGTAHPAYAVIDRLLDRGNTWVKLSSAYQDSRTGAPGYSDVGEVAKAFVKRAPERMLWGTDWPHPGVAKLPDDAGMFDLLSGWTPDAGTRQRILVDNPAILYGFPAD